MDSLPAEIIHQILVDVPTSSLSAIRLVSRKYAALAFPVLFKHIPFWLDHAKSHQAITKMAHDCYSRPAIMWSPFALCPELDVESKNGRGWLEVCWGMSVGTKVDVDGMVTVIDDSNDAEGGEERKEKKVKLTAINFAALSGNEEMSAHRLKLGMNRLLMWKGYREKRFLEHVVLGLPFCPY